MPKADKQLRNDLREQVEHYEGLGWEFDLDHKKTIFLAKLVRNDSEAGSTEVQLHSNASVENLLLQIEKYYEDLAAESMSAEFPGIEPEGDDMETEDNPGKPRKELPKTAIESVRIELTVEELLKRSFSLSNALNEKVKAEVEYASRLKALKADHESKMTLIHRNITKFHNAVDTKSEWRDVECILDWNFEKKEVWTIRPDTGEVVKQRLMTSEECQQELFE